MRKLLKSPRSFFLPLVVGLGVVGATQSWAQSVPITNGDFAAHPAGPPPNQWQNGTSSDYWAPTQDPVCGNGKCNAAAAPAPPVPSPLTNAAELSVNGNATGPAAAETLTYTYNNTNPSSPTALGAGFSSFATNTFLANTTYYLSFYAGIPSGNAGGSSALSFIPSISENGSNLTLNAFGSTPSGTPPIQNANLPAVGTASLFVYSFTTGANAATDPFVLSFELQNGTNGTATLDFGNVSITAAPGPVPGAGLLSYLALAIIGFGSMGWKRLRTRMA